MRLSSFTKPQISPKIRTKCTVLMTGAQFPCSSVESLFQLQGDGGRHTHGWSAPHGLTLCGLCPISDSGDSQPELAQLTFCVPFYYNDPLRKKKTSRNRGWKCLSCNTFTRSAHYTAGLPADRGKFLFNKGWYETKSSECLRSGAVHYCVK